MASSTFFSGTKVAAEGWSLFSSPQMCRWAKGEGLRPQSLAAANATFCKGEGNSLQKDQPYLLQFDSPHYIQGRAISLSEAPKMFPTSKKKICLHLLISLPDTTVNFAPTSFSHHLAQLSSPSAPFIRKQTNLTLKVWN